MHTYRIRARKSSGFTLVEILIVVIILGILAAIVIPQFTNASQDARESSVVSQLQTLRSQVELYKLQHHEQYPTDDGTAAGAWDWTLLTGKTDEFGTAGGTLGPYLQQTPVNPLNNNTTMASAATDADAATTPADGDAFVFSQETGKIWATNSTEDGLYAE